MKQPFILTLVSSVACAATAANKAPENTTPTKSKTPNVVFIYADDLGYGDLECYGAKNVQTPNVNRLAKSGILFTNAHATAATTTPSRYSMLTGEYGKELGIYFYMMTGGEPMVRKKDIIELCRKHNDCVFFAYTNGTLVDEALCKQMQEVGNLFLALSVEGEPDVNDMRRGEGVYNKVMHAMDLLKEHGLVFGTSICYTSANYKSVTSEDFIQMLVEKGCRYALYFHYMPVGNAASVDLLLNPEQRIYVKNRVREIRNMEHGPGIFTMDFQNDGEFVGGCIAGGRNYFHINANGDAEPCVFIHYSNGNIHENTILEILKQPLFMAYHDNQPFNDNMLRPCPMLENPEILQRIVKESGAHSTDLQSNETAEHLCGKCLHYAEEWAPVAEKLWAEEKAEKAAKEANK